MSRYNFSFKEKSRLDEGWINGGFFVLEPEIFDYIKFWKYREIQEV